MQYLELIGVVVGLLYLYWEYKASIYLWGAAIVMPAIYIFVYLDAGFYADMGINIYYLVASLYGLAFWFKRDKEQKPLKITRTPRRFFLPIAAVSALLWVAIWFILDRFTDSNVALGDSFTTALSVVGLWMLTRKYVEQWILWIAVDVVCAVLYFRKGLDPTAYLYALYTVIAIFGYFKWLKMSRTDANTPTN